MRKFVATLALTGIVDAISYMVVAPSIVFYVLEHGGTKAQYGMILSSYSFASFCCKPLLGAWTDSHGFRTPYLLSQALSATGGLCYLLASAFADGTPAVTMMLLGRLLGGVGAANSTLGFIYVARVLPHDEQTSTNSLLSMTRILGMALGPGLNWFLQHADFRVGSFAVEPLNAVGLVLIVTNLTVLLFLWLYLDEPPPDEPTKHAVTGVDASAQHTTTTMDLVKAVLSPDIMLYILSIFSFNANFQLIETASSPVASHALGWGPVQISFVMGCMSVAIMANMFVVFRLSARKVRDGTMLTFGLLLGALGYSSVYLSWTSDMPTWRYYLPMLLGISSFPYLGAPTRSLFTVAVDAQHVLDAHHGKMQAVLSMGASVAGFVSPGLIATFVLRPPEEVEASADRRELNAGALYAPLLSLVTLFGHLWLQQRQQRWQGTTNKDAATTVDEQPPHETTALVATSTKDGTNKHETTPASCNVSRRRLVRRASTADRHLNKFRPDCAAHRHSSCTMMGISQTHLHVEDHPEEESTTKGEP